MKRFAFTLQRMLGYKRSLYEKERNELARLRHERAKLQQRRDDTEAGMYQKDREFRFKAAGIGVDSNDLASATFYRTSCEHLIRELEGQLQKMDLAIEKQLARVIELDRDVQGLEKLREKQLEEYRVAAAAEERERILELVSGKYLVTREEAATEELTEAARRQTETQLRSDVGLRPF